MGDEQKPEDPGEQVALAIDSILRVLDKSISVIPYVTATIGPGGVTSDQRDDWISIHKGRAWSSYRQLKALRLEIEAVKELAVDLKGNYEAEITRLKEGIDRALLSVEISNDEALRAEKKAAFWKSRAEYLEAEIDYKE